MLPTAHKGLPQHTPPLSLPMNPALRILGGTDDPFGSTIINFSEQLTTLKIKHTLAEAPARGHDYKGYSGESLF